LLLCSAPVRRRHVTDRARAQKAAGEAKMRRKLLGTSRFGSLLVLFAERNVSD